MQENIYKTSQLLELTKENYKVLETEQNVYHARIEVKQFDPATGKRISKPLLQKFEAKGFKEMLPGLQRQGFTVDVLYDPTKYNEERREARRAANSRLQAIRAEQVQQQKDAEREALRAEMRKEIEAEMASQKKEAPKKK